MTEFPNWLTTKENYEASTDRDAFLNKSILSVLSVLHSFRDTKTSYGLMGHTFPASLKLLVCLALIITTSCLHQVFWLAVMIAIVLLHLCFLSNKQLIRTISTSLAAALFTALIMLPATFFGSSQSLVLISFKVFISVSLVGILASTTEWNRITAGLSSFHIPSVFIFTLDITLKYIVILGDISIDMLNALKLRSIGKNKDKSSSLSGVLGVTFLKSRHMADEMYDAMLCRGLGIQTDTTQSPQNNQVEAANSSKNVHATTDKNTQGDQMNNPLIEIKDICFAYDGIIALRHVSFEVNKGETIALQGSNGCGKSTLLKLINGLIFAEQGEYIFDGRPVTKASLRDSQFTKNFHQRIGFVFQNPDVQLFCNNVHDEIAFGPTQMGLGKEVVEQRVQDVMKMIGIERLAERAPYQLSGGEKKRVALASVLSMNPDILVLDEPLAGLDSRTQDWLTDFLQSLQEAGKTLIISTHDDNLAHLLGDHILYMNEDHTVDYIL